MSTGGKFGRPWRRRNVVGATAIVALVVVSLLTLGSATGHQVALHHSGDAAAAGTAMSSTHALSRAHGHASLVSRASGHAAHHSLSSSGSSSSSSSPLSPASGPASSAASRSLAAVNCGSASSPIATASGFEDADGNLAIDTAGCMDWNGFTPTWTGTAPNQTGTASNNGFDFIGLTDAFNSSSDTIYSGGVKQDTVCPNVTTGNVNDKADLSRIYIATKTVNNHVYLFLAWERQIDNTTQSDVFVSFEFNQGQLACANNDGFVQRTPGDLLVDYNFQSGSSSIDVQEWNGTTWVALPTPPFEAAVNQGDVTDTLGPHPPASRTLTKFEFGEAGIDLSALNLSGNGGRACETFGSVLGGSRTSKSGDTAQLKDYIGPAPLDVSNCVTPTIITTQQPASGAMGATFKDTATLSDAVNLDGTGSITFKLYSAADCGGSVLDTETVTGINANGDYTTPTGKVLNAAGTYYWVASFSGDGFNNPVSSGCNDEPVVVNQAQPSIVTTQQPATAVVGSTFKDKATLSDAVNLDGTGSITFKLYTAADCGGSVIDTETVTGINANGDYTTPTGKKLDQTGTYYWVASFSGDSNNDAFTSPCNAEPVVVTPAQPSIVTTQQPSTAVVGSTFKDKATLSDATNLDGTGSITFKLYTAADCGGSVIDTETVTGISANGDYTTPTGKVLNNAGTYYWVASFSGDSNNDAFTSPCNAEPVVVTPAQPSIVTTQLPAAGSAGDLYKDKATLSDAVALDGTGSITFKLYTAADCGGSVIDTETVTGISANGDYTTPTGKVLNNAGTYYWVASFSGDSNNNAFTSPCNDEPVAVNSAEIHIVKTADAAQVNAGEPIGFTLTVYNDGSGDAKGVVLTDTLPTEPGLSWTIDSQDTGWNNTCAIAAGVLQCGPVTVPANTSQALSTFKVHITSPTTADTGGVCPGGSGVIDNTGHVTTTNDGTDDDTASTCVAAPEIHIVKTADAAQVNAGEPIGFTLTVYNAGSGDAHDVNLTDTLPTNAGLDWTIDSQQAGWNNTCAIAAGVLTCGPVTVPAGTTQALSTFTVHITSPTTADTGGVCPGGSGVVDNTGHVTTGNDGSDDSTAETCVAAPDIHIVKTADAAQVNAGEPIGFTLTVYNTGSGDAKGVTLTDTLPTNAGLDWSIESQGAGWNGTCAIAAGVLSCGPVTVPAGTAQGDPAFEVHITSPTTAATGGVCPGGSGVVDNTGHVTTTNDGSDDSTASTCVAAPGIHIVKTADAAQVNVGSPIGFTLTVYNTGGGDARGVTLSDTLPTNAGLNWSIAAQGAGWNGTCAIAGGKLTCGPVTVPAGTTQAASTFTVHITSPTTGATGGDCPSTGVVNNTGDVTSANGGSDESSASTCVQALVDLSITKAGSPASQTLGDGNITWTIVVTNNGPSDATGVTLADPMPAGNTFVSASSTQGSCTGGAILNCNIGTMAAGASVTITLVTTPSTVGDQTNTATVAGSRPETNTGNNSATATVQTVGVITPPVFCVAVSKVTPKQLFVGRKTKLTIHVTQRDSVTRKVKAVKGVHVRIKGPKIDVRTHASNSKGVITTRVKMKKAGILIFSPIASKRCNTKRVGVTNVFTPPVTG